MQRSEIVAAIDKELATLRQVRDLLSSSSGVAVLAEKAGITSVHKTAIKTTGKKKRVMSAEARARIGLAQKRRWAKQRKTEAVPAEKK
jgi:hypothetical protein